MNRVIKFRAWDKKRKTMLLAGQFSLTSFGKTFKTNSDFEQEELPNLEIMQFTGLTDKNGKDVYEGDIVRLLNGWGWKDGANDSAHMQGIGEVRYTSTKYQAYRKDDTFMPLDWGGTESIEVIGNVFDNPELLEEKSV